ncbi:universal stress protein [Aeromicrobium senzhongii]|uniref:Universal stress protein n=1 Tax=Aeromicrobium senzhongii TaxID=2663859 RepID=A0ABX6STP3_9ACTN|nr:universal stress protein [Aeromicrobium senzhongii]MTB88945.1 universal stress protein [Aeromicrobium senzhongii]QNL93774.1 universal stress protein [Aeromicrobium senzhongii]
MSRTIVTGVDGSETAAKAAHTAAELAQALDAQLYVLSAYGKYHADTFNSGEEEIVFSTAKDAEHTAEGTVAQLRHDFPGLRIVAAPAEGKPGDALVKAAQRLQADLIVVGNKRVQGLARVLGSVARDVAAQAPCDVYVAHTHDR